MENTTRAMPVPVTWQPLESLKEPEIVAPAAGALNVTPVGPLALPFCTFTVRVTDADLSVDLADGRTITVPLGWYPRLEHGSTTEQLNSLNNWNYHSNLILARASEVYVPGR